MPTKNIVFIDSRVADYQTLIDDLGPDSKWVLLVAELDGIKQIESALSEYSNLNSIQLVSHGSVGTLYLGSTILDSNNLDSYSGQLQSIGSSLTSSGDLLLYGCNVAQGYAGQVFINQMAHYTGADVAASNDLTGNTALGGDWMLESAVGTIESSPIDLGENFSGVLFAQQGGSGNDVFYGGGDNDTLKGGDGNDNLYGSGGNNVLMGEAGNDYLSVYGETGANLLDGGAGDDSLSGGGGDDTLDGGLGSDILIGGGGNDIYYIDDLSDTIWEEAGDDTVYVSVNGYLESNDIEHVIYAGGAEPLPYFIRALCSGYSWGEVGQAQSLTYSFVTQATDGVTGFASYSTEQQGYVRQVLGRYSAVSGVHFTEVADSSDVELRYFRDDLNSAGYGAYAGYAYYPTSGDVHIKTGYEDMSPDAYGFQLLLHETGHALGLKHPFEAPVLDPTEDTQTNTVMTYNNSWPCVQNIGLFDLASIQYLYGVNNTARIGNDTYRISDRYIWDGAGVDTLSASDQTQSVSVSLRAGSWIFVGSKASSILASGQAFVGFGTVLENAIGGGGNDTISGNEINNQLSGGIGSDSVSGFSGSDTLDGGAGIDTMVGGDGSDYYYVRDSGDVVTETNATASTGGTDRIYSYLSSYILGGNVEEGRIMSSGVASLSGNSLNNVLFAGVGDNVLAGGAGTDSISFYYAVASGVTSGVTVTLSGGSGTTTGGSGTDTLSGIERLCGTNNADKFTGDSNANYLYGYAGSDILDGGAGIDTMVGGDGSDYYYVRNSGDVVTETNATASTGGTDRIFSYLSSYILGANVEEGRIMSSGVASLSGNSLYNVLFAGVGDNVLAGGAGTDSVSFYYAVASGVTSGVTVALSGGSGTATGGSGTDVLTGIERLYGTNNADKFTGDSNANYLCGYAGSDTLSGGGGNDALVGGSGKDSLTGGSGNDLFDFNALSEMGVAGATRDVITDFSTGDRIDLSSLDANTGTSANDAFSAITVGGAFTGVFGSGTGTLYFDSANHVLYANANADTFAEFAIQLTGVTTLNSASFIL